MTEPAASQPSGPPSSTVTFFFEKTSSFQTLHADGVLGSLTPSGQVFLAFYVERSPIPKTVICPVENGEVGEPSEIAGKKGIFREIHSAIVLSPSALSDLKGHIEKLQKTLQELSNAK